MAVYTYIAKDEKGGTVTGTYTDVESTSVLRDELDKMGYVLVKARRGKQPRNVRRRPRKVKLLEVATFAYKFAGMYTAGLPQGAVADYMSWVAGRDGQCMMAKMGYAPAQPVRC